MAEVTFAVSASKRTTGRGQWTANASAAVLTPGEPANEVKAITVMVSRLSG